MDGNPVVTYIKPQKAAEIWMQKAVTQDGSHLLLACCSQFLLLAIFILHWSREEDMKKHFRKQEQKALAPDFHEIWSFLRSELAWKPQMPILKISNNMIVSNKEKSDESNRYVHWISQKDYNDPVAVFKSNNHLLS